MTSQTEQKCFLHQEIDHILRTRGVSFPCFPFYSSHRTVVLFSKLTKEYDK